MESCDGVIVPGGFGERGISGKIKAVKYSRENNVPFLGICLGMQIAALEIAKNLLKIDDATSLEFHKDAKKPVIHLMESQKKIKSKGATMRLGSYPCSVKAGSLAAKCYGSLSINERHRHRYEFNNEYRKPFEEVGVTFSGLSPDGELVEMMEVNEHSFFIGCQFHPEYKSRPTKPHPLFLNLLKTAWDYKKSKPK